MGLSPMPVFRPSVVAIVFGLLVWAILLGAGWVGWELFWAAWAAIGG